MKNVMKQVNISWCLQQATYAFEWDNFSAVETEYLLNNLQIKLLVNF